jgi:hypothetical protein
LIRSPKPGCRGVAKEILRRGLSFVLLLGALVLTAAVISEANRVKGYETDLAELNDVRYGLLDADNWVEQITSILERRIDALELAEDNRPAIKRQVERVLDRLLVEIAADERRRNEQGATWFDRLHGSLRQGVQDLFLDLDEVRQKVLFYAEQECPGPGACVLRDR